MKTPTLSIPLIFIFLLITPFNFLIAGFPSNNSGVYESKECINNIGVQNCNEDSKTENSKLLLKLKSAALTGDADTQFRLGEIYRRGWLGIEKDKEEAFKWVKMSAESGHPAGQGTLGAMLSIGFGVPVNYLKAYKWTRIAALKGIAEAQANLGVMYMYGHGILKNENRAIQWLRKAVDQDNTLAKILLGKIHLSKGRKLRTSNLDCQKMWACLRAFRHYKIAAQLKNTNAMVFLGNMIIVLNKRRNHSDNPKWLMWLLLANRFEIRDTFLRKNVKGLLKTLKKKKKLMKTSDILANQCIVRGLKDC